MRVISYTGTLFTLYVALVVITQVQSQDASSTLAEDSAPSPSVIHRSEMPIEHQRGEEELDKLEAEIARMESDEYVENYASMDHESVEYEEYMRSMGSHPHDGNEL